MQVTILAGQFYRDLSGLGMTHDVGEGLLCDAETFGFDDRVEPAIEALGAKFSPHADQGGLPMGVPAQGRLQPEVVQHRRP